MTDQEVLEKLKFITESDKIFNVDIIHYPIKRFAKIVFTFNNCPWIAEYFYDHEMVHTRNYNPDGSETTVNGSFEDFKKFLIEGSA